MIDDLTKSLPRAAVLIMDYQNYVVGSYPSQGPSLVAKAASVLQRARQAGIPVVYVVLRFRPGYPEVSLRNKSFAALRNSGQLVEGTPGAEVHPEVAPQPGDVVVTRRRAGAFSTTDLDAVLKAKDVDTLVLLGISTSGVVLSTIRWAADMDYRLVVLADCCTDRDEELHRLLMEKVFTRQATVMNSRDFLELVNRTAPK